jgi:hypothetical protein
MISKLPESKDATIGIEISGKISTEEESKWIEVFDKLIEEHGDINVLVELDGRINFGIDVAFSDLKWTFKNIKNMNKLALVSDSKVLGLLVAADSPFGKLVGVSEKHFESSKLADAWEWVKE